MRSSSRPKTVVVVAEEVVAEEVAARVKDKARAKDNHRRDRVNRLRRVKGSHLRKVRGKVNRLRKAKGSHLHKVRGKGSRLRKAKGNHHHKVRTRVSRLRAPRKMQAPVPLRNGRETANQVRRKISRDK